MAWYDTPQSISGLNDLFREVLLPPMRDQLNREVFILSRLNRRTEALTAKQWDIPLEVGRNEGIGFTAENKTLPVPGSQDVDRGVLSPKHFYGRMLLTGVVMDLTKNDIAALARAIDLESRGLIRDMKSEVCRVLYGDGNGILALVNTTTGGGIVFDVDSPWGLDHYNTDTRGAMHIRAGMWISQMAVSSQTVDWTAKVASVSGNTITLVGSSISYTEDRAIVRSNVESGGTYIDRSYGGGSAWNEAFGLGAIVDDGDVASFMGITVSGNDWWASYEKSQSGTAYVTEIGLQECLDQVEIDSGKVPTVFLTSHNVRRYFANSLVGDKRFVNTLTLAGGWNAVEAHGKPMVVDHLCPEPVLFGLYENDLAIWQTDDLQWIDDDGAILHRLEDKDVFQATVKWRFNFGCYARNSHFMMNAIKLT